jgi:hypothetical protein
MLSREWLKNQVTMGFLRESPANDRVQTLLSDSAAKIISSPNDADAKQVADSLRKRLEIAKITGTKLDGIDVLIGKLESLVAGSRVRELVLTDGSFSILAVAGADDQLLGVVLISASVR